MKHLIKNNQIVMSGLPSNFDRENGESFWGGYEFRTDLHYADGWREEVIPEFNPLTQYLGDIYYNSVEDIITYNILDIPIDLNEEKQSHIMDLIRLREEISLIITQIRLLYDPEPELLSQITPMIRGLYSFAKDEINNLTIENVRPYILRGPQVQELLTVLNSML